ncbi:tyrosine-protein phosphatase [Streptomyces sp. NPDC004327]|uniref:tyrosine-protein phosphatase n=1 Tax=Streptomyces sp. NPDC004327 TaxID=3364699 RepID=UPI0036AA3845
MPLPRHPLPGRALSRRALLSTAGAAGLLALAAPPALARPRSRPGTPTANAIRLIPLQGAVNVRDLGGHGTYDGRRVRYGLVHRGDHLGKLTDADVAVLGGLGLGRVIDFRIPLEVRYDGADRLPAGVLGVSRPVTDNGLYGQLLAAIGSRDPVRQEQMLGGGRAAAFMTEVYRTFVTSAANREQLGTTLRELAAPGAAPVLYHCTSGKDRTGWESWLLLTLLGVPERAATDDYLASNTFRAAYDARVREGLKQSGMMQDPDLIVPLQEVRQEYLDTALAEVRAGYGGLFRYVTEGLGLDLRTLAALRERLVG